jgi:hypothetical protein
MKNKLTGIYVLLFIFCGSTRLSAQQNHTMYLMHYLPESNLLNPAVPISCKWYIGLPVLSSVHVNYANSSFSYNNLFDAVGNGVYETNIDKAVRHLHFRNYIGTEIHLQLFALGYRKNDYSFVFTITEKNNLPVTYPKKPVSLLWGGNTQFEGDDAGFRGSGLFFTHYREYAIAASKHSGNGLYYGVRAKLLFGKLNIATRSADIDLYTDETTFDLTFDGNFLAHSSLPVVFDVTDNQLNDVYYNEDITPLQLALNRKNPGFAIDAGIVYPYSNKVEISASVIDLGFVRWRSNLNTLEGSGNFFYNGPMGDNINEEAYLGDLMDAFTDSMNLEVTQQKYTTFLPPRLLAGATYQVNNYLLAGLQTEAIFHRTKIIPSVTFTAQAEPVNNIHLIASYSLQYYSLKSFGLGLVLGRDPVQFYIISDDVPAMIWPLSARNINLRFGLNINLGCTIKESKKAGSGKGQLQGNCYWLEKSIQKEYQRSKKRK